MKLPHAERAIVDGQKVRDDLLSYEHPVGRYKAAFFRRLGYRRDGWQKLADDLMALSRENPAVAVEETRYGDKYLVRGILRGPRGREAAIQTVWLVPVGERLAKLVTAYPGGDR